MKQARARHPHGAVMQTGPSLQAIAQFIHTERRGTAVFAHLHLAPPSWLVGKMTTLS
jgi:hypothetical protein